MILFLYFLVLQTFHSPSLSLSLNLSLYLFETLPPSNALFRIISMYHSLLLIPLSILISFHYFSFICVGAHDGNRGGSDECCGENHVLYRQHRYNIILYPPFLPFLLYCCEAFSFFSSIFFSLIFSIIPFCSCSSPFIYILENSFFTFAYLSACTYQISW